MFFFIKVVLNISLGPGYICLKEGVKGEIMKAEDKPVG